MIENIPSAEGLNEIALRLHFDAWKNCINLISDFCDFYDIQTLPSAGVHNYSDEWNEYIDSAQSELGAICMTIQHSAELRLKSIICSTSPFLLLLNGNIKFSSKGIDFSQLRTLDAVDLPNAVISLTSFSLPPSYLKDYARMRGLRNKFAHLGLNERRTTPDEIILALCQQYISLWPDGKWLYRRVRFDGNSARNYFHDYRYSSSESDVMAELPLTIKIMSNIIFKKSFGFPKSKLSGFCPNCMSNRASKWDANGHPTAFQTSGTTAHCAMCEQEFMISKDHDYSCGCQKRLFAFISDDHDPLCFHCGGNFF